MLHHPHTRYRRLFVYYLDRLQIPSIEHPDLIGVWIEDDHSVLFFHSPQDAMVRNICRSSSANIIYQADLDYRDWEAGVTIGPFNTKALSIRPVWDEPCTDVNKRREIILDPSVIFGSGFHPTTRLCLENLEHIIICSDKKIRKVADLGTGTGLLSIAAAKLGAEKVLAIDNNPLACEVARKNVEMNGCGREVEVLQHDLTKDIPDFNGYDLVMANLYKVLLVQLFSEPSFWKADKYLISGIIPSMEGDLLEALPEEGIRFLHRGNNEMWRLWLLGTGEK